MIKRVRSFFTIICTTSLLFWINITVAANIDIQRQQFLQAYEALQKGDLATYQQLEPYLHNYLLYYYLRYSELQPKLKSADPNEVHSYLEQYGNTAFGDLLRRDWLYQLAKQGNWFTFIDLYTPQKSTSLQCYYAIARLETNRDTEQALTDTKNLWLVGKSQPTACDTAFDSLYASPLMNDDLLWQRIRLAMANNQIGLGAALAKKLNASDQAWFSLWQAVHEKPIDTLADFIEPDVPIAREIILHGIRRIAKKQFELADQYWKMLQLKYAFSVDQIGEMDRDLAIACGEQNHPDAFRRLTAVDKRYITDSFHEKRLKIALERQNWQAVADFVTELPNDKRNALQWQYWHARALEQLDKIDEAQKLYKQIAAKRDYYSFLAADRVHLPYQMENYPIHFSVEEETDVLKNTSIAKALEFYLIGLNTIGRKEWQYAVDQMTTRQQEIASVIASRHGWYDRAIITAAKAGAYDDLTVRFPLPYRPQLLVGADSQELDLAWVYGIVRQESAFMADVKSYAGALGLMQLMPATGKHVAKKIGLSIKNNQDILEIENNIALGTAYLRQMLDKFDGNYMLATAAYNAGPGRAQRWSETYRCLPADIFVELIPFNETRNYVQKVLFYTSVFESRLGQTMRPLRVALAQDSDCDITSAMNKEESQPTKTSYKTETW